VIRGKVINQIFVYKKMTTSICGVIKFTMATKTQFPCAIMTPIQFTNSLVSVSSCESHLHQLIRFWWEVIRLLIEKH